MEFSGTLYHVIARGNEQRDIFRDDADRDLYLRRLAHYRDRFRFRLYAYCLMTNHVHLALETGEVPLSRIMLALHGSYAQAFNQRHARVGHLFQGRYKALVVQKTAYLLALVRYIHENPVKAGIVIESRLYRWSSDRYYRGAHPPDWIDTRGLLELLGADPARAANRYREFMKCLGPNAYEDSQTFGQIIKGDEDFALNTLKVAADPETRRRAWTLEQITRTVARRENLGVVDLRSRALSFEKTRARATIGYVAWKHARIPLTKVAEFFHRHGTTLVRDVRRFESDLEKRADLRERLASIVQELDGS